MKRRTFLDTDIVFRDRRQINAQGVLTRRRGPTALTQFDNLAVDQRVPAATVRDLLFDFGFTDRRK